MANNITKTFEIARVFYDRVGKDRRLHRKHRDILITPQIDRNCLFDYIESEVDDRIFEIFSVVFREETRSMSIDSYKLLSMPVVDRISARGKICRTIPVTKVTFFDIDTEKMQVVRNCKFFFGNVSEKKISKEIDGAKVEKIEKSEKLYALDFESFYYFSDLIER